jgi:hypothetical protein
MPAFPTRRPADLGRFSTLLATLLATLLLAPFLPKALFGVSLFRVLVGAILLAGVYAVSRRPPVFAVGLAIAVPALVVETWLQVRPSSSLVVGSYALSTLFLLFLAAVILYGILDEERVTLDTIFGGICVYLLIGVTWALTYSVLEHLRPASFQVDGGPLPALAGADEFRHAELIYFSFVTLTTVGYGDVLAKTNPARALAAAEAVTGSLYLAVFIARLVGLHMVHQRRDLDL